MKILGIDTSTKRANVTVKSDDICVSKSVDNEITHSEKLLPLIDTCLNESNLNIKDIDSFACTIGPGSFTGIRIGIATIKAFAKVAGANIFAVSTLDVLAYSKISEDTDYVISIMDARNSRIYYCVYKVKHLKHYSSTIPVLDPLCEYSNEIFSDALDNICVAISKETLDVPKIVFACDNTELYEDKINDKFDLSFNDIIVSESILSTDTLINMYINYAKLGYDTEHLKNYLTLDALYARPSQAERAKNGDK